MAELPDRSRQERKLAWNDEARQIALEHHAAVQARTERDPKRPRYICIILSDMVETEEDEAKRDALLEAIYHAEFVNRELMSRGFAYPEEVDVSERVRELRREARRR